MRPIPVTGLAAAPGAGGTVDLSWTALAGATGYRVYRSAFPGGILHDVRRHDLGDLARRHDPSVRGQLLRRSDLRLVHERVLRLERGVGDGRRKPCHDYAERTDNLLRGRERDADGQCGLLLYCRQRGDDAGDRRERVDLLPSVTVTHRAGAPISAPTTVTVNPTPATPTITPGGPTTFCAGGSVTLTSSSASGNQWYLDGNPIGGATSQTYIATAIGTYTVVVTASGLLLGRLGTDRRDGRSPALAGRGHQRAARRSSPATATTTATRSRATPTRSLSQAGVTYAWTASAGATILSGQGTASIRVVLTTRPAPSRSRSTPTNGCGTIDRSRRASRSPRPPSSTSSRVGHARRMDAGGRHVVAGRRRLLGPLGPERDDHRLGQLRSGLRRLHRRGRAGRHAHGTGRQPGALDPRRDAALPLQLPAVEERLRLPLHRRRPLLHLEVRRLRHPVRGSGLGRGPRRDSSTAAAQPNKLKVVASGSQFDFYINDTLVKTVVDPTFTSGKVGVQLAHDRHLPERFGQLGEGHAGGHGRQGRASRGDGEPRAGGRKRRGQPSARALRTLP